MKSENEAVYQIFSTFFNKWFCSCLLQKLLYDLKLIHLFSLVLVKYNDNFNGYLKAPIHEIMIRVTSSQYCYEVSISYYYIFSFVFYGNFENFGLITKQFC